MLITFGAAFVIAQFSGSIEKLWKIFGSIGSASLLVPLLTALYRKTKVPQSAGVASMLAGCFTVVGLMLIEKFSLLSFSCFYEIEALYPGLIMSFGAYVFFCLFGKRRS